MSAKDNTKGQETDRVKEQPSSQSNSSDRLRSDTHESGLGSKRNIESASASSSMQKDGLVGNLSIDNKSGQSLPNKTNTRDSQSGTVENSSIDKRGGNDKSRESRDGGDIKQGDLDKAGDGQDKQRDSDPQSVLNDTKASPEDKIRAAHKMAESGQKEFKGEDGRKYSIHNQKYGERNATVVSTTDKHGRFMPVLRGMVDKQGNVTHQKYTNGREASYESGEDKQNSKDSTDGSRGFDNNKKDSQQSKKLNPSDSNSKESSSNVEQEDNQKPEKITDKTGKGDNQEKVWNFLRKDLHLSKEQAAGVMGNIEQESHFDPNRHQYGGGPGYGLAQWGDSRRKDLEKQRNPESLDTQLQFMKKEFNTTHHSAYRALKNSRSLEDATRAFSEKYEVAGRPKMTARLKYARQALGRFGSREDE